MLFRPTALAGVMVIDLEPAVDDRGFFARTFCTREFAAHGLVTDFVQHSLSRTLRAGTVRGMHFQGPPHQEVKLLRCIKGAIHDVLVDIRPDSPTYMQWEAYLLTPDNQRQLYVPAGLAHGFQTLEPDTEVAYLISQFYAPQASTGIRHDDPAFKIAWPLPVTDLSAKDRNWPHYARTGADASA